MLPEELVVRQADRSSESDGACGLMLTATYHAVSPFGTQSLPTLPGVRGKTSLSSRTLPKKPNQLSSEQQETCEWPIQDWLVFDPA